MTTMALLGNHLKTSAHVQCSFQRYHHHRYRHRPLRLPKQQHQLKYQCPTTAATPIVTTIITATTSTALLANNPWGIWAALACAGAAGLQLERTKWGKEMSGALLSTLIGLALSNLGIVPADAPQYAIVNAYLLPLAVPMLLFAADLRRVLTQTGRLLTAFILGAVATVAGSCIAFSFMPLRSLGADGYKVAGALTARHIGGSVNYVAVSEALSLSPTARMVGLAADDVIVSVYFVVLYALARRSPPDQAVNKISIENNNNVEVLDASGSGVGVGEGVEAEADSTGDDDGRRSMGVLNGATAVALAASICAIGTYIANLLRYKGGSITIITALTVTLATIAPKFVTPFIASGEGLAVILIQIFFASVGASGNVKEVVHKAPSLFLWSAVAISVHLLLMLLFERVFSFTRRETCLASNANIGGPTTAAGMAQAKGWKSSMVPALLVGILGYATATFIGVGCSHVFKAMQ